jgi:hypothetical protein
MLEYIRTYLTHQRRGLNQMLDNHWMADRIVQAAAAHDEPQARITTCPQGG